MHQIIAVWSHLRGGSFISVSSAWTQNKHSVAIRLFIILKQVQMAWCQVVHCEVQSKDLEAKVNYSSIKQTEDNNFQDMVTKWALKEEIFALGYQPCHSTALFCYVNIFIPAHQNQLFLRKACPPGQHQQEATVAAELEISWSVRGQYFFVPPCASVQ